MAAFLQRLAVPGLALCCACTLVGGTGVRFRYSIIDLGTFGGPTSIAWAINNDGVVVGGGDAGDGWRHPFRWENGQIFDLGNLGGTLHYEATDISDNGIIVGYSTSNGNLGGGFIWQNGQMSSIEPSNRPKIALGVNDSGQVVGQAAFPPPGGGTRAFFYENGTMTDLGTLGGGVSLAWDINNDAQVVGRSFTGSGERAFLWQGGSMVDLGTLTPGSSEARAVNSVGSVVGRSNSLAFLWEEGTMTEVAPGEFGSSDAWGINRHGQIVGNPAFLYDPLYGVVGLEDSLSPNPGWSQLNPRDINDAGQIVGTGTNPLGFRRAFLMDPLPPIPAASAWTLAAAALGLILLGIAVLRGRGEGAGT